MNPLFDLIAIAVISTAFWSLAFLTPPSQPFGVRIPPEHTEASIVFAQRRRFTSRVLSAGGVAAVAAIAAGLALTENLIATSLITAALVVADIAFMFAAQRAIAAAKRDEGWYSGTRQAVAVDTGLRTDPVRFPWAAAAVPAVIAAGSIAVGVVRYPKLSALVAVPSGHSEPVSFTAAFGPVIGQVAMTALCGVIVFAVLRSRPDLDASRPTASARKYRIYLRRVTRLLMLTAAAGNVTLLLAALQTWGIAPVGTATTVATVAIPVLVLAGWVWFGVAVGPAGYRLPAAPGDEPGAGRFVTRDDSRHWKLGGLIYHNPDDSAVLVPKRIGIGWTLNLARPVTWILIAVLVAFAVLAGTGVIDVPRTQGINLADG